MRFALPVILAITLLISLERARAAETARDLAADCQVFGRSKIGAGRHIRIPQTKEALSCWGFMEAMQALSVLVDESGRRIIGSCPSERTTTLDLVDAFLKYARSHQDQLEGNAAAAAINAFQDAFPCSQASAPLEWRPIRKD